MNISVSQLNSYVSQLLFYDEALNDITVRGEISGLKMHSSGHVYFSLKDESATIRCAFFKQYAQKLKFSPKDGTKVFARGRVSLYERDGTYQLTVFELTEDGVGDLYEKFVLLKQKLQDEGLFDQAYKKPIPRYVKKIGVVTSPTGAVIKDIYNVASRRCPDISILLAPVAVQGDDAPRSICAGIRALQDREDVDVIIVGRGGGSMEDLWCFNSEEVARCIFDCPKPIISAVGHETDFTIADFVADLRAPTPSAAAELAVFDFFNTVEMLEEKKKYMISQVQKKFEKYRLEISKNETVFAHPEKLTENFYQRLDLLYNRLENAQDGKYNAVKNKLAVFAGKMDSLSPLKVLSRGYSVVADQYGKSVKSIKNISVGETVKIKFSDGVAKAEVKNIYEN